MHASWKLTNVRENVWKNSALKIMKIALQERKFNSLSQYNLVHRFIPMPQAKKILDAKAAVDKVWEKLEKLPAWQMTKKTANEEVMKAVQRELKTIHFATLMDIRHLKNAQPVCTILALMQYLHRAGFVCITNDCRKNDGCHDKATKMGKTSSRRIISVHPSQNWRTLQHH